MSQLTLVRHGQATAFDKVSDRLSEIGELQSRRLAEFWLQSGVAFDEVHTGTLVRQQRTESIIADCFRKAGVPWPAAQVSPGFDEYDAVGVLTNLVPALEVRDPQFAKLVEAFEAVRQTPERNRAFQRMFETALTAWSRGETVGVAVEPLPAFRARVLDALGLVQQGAPNRRVVAFTSGGPIGLLVQTAMRAPDEMFLEVNWRVRNCSLTEFVFSGSRFTLDAFNGLPHLGDRALWTYR